MTSIKTDLRRKVVNATQALTLIITQDNINKAKCKDPEQCVIAQAIYSFPLGMVASIAHIGASTSKIVCADRVIRYKTPAKLAKALAVFDKTELWHLPVGEYSLLPYTGAQRRWESAKRNGGTQDVFAPIISAPTRKTINIGALCKITDAPPANSKAVAPAKKKAAKRKAA